MDNLVEWLQGLGTSTDREFKDYFQALDKHRIRFRWTGELTLAMCISWLFLNPFVACFLSVAGG